MPALTSIAMGVGALGGAISGGSDSTTTSGRNVAPPTQRELDLQNESFNSYMKQLALSQEGEAGIQGGAGVQGASRGALENIIGGSALNISPEQQAQVNAIRDASVQAGTGDIQNFVNQNLSSIGNNAGVRGLRGQALSELQGRSIGEGARQIGNLTSQANATAAQQSLDVPYRQAQLQGGLANQNANFMETLRQQAIQNRNQLQNPALMNTLQNERIGSATTTNTTPGSLGGAIGGAMGGFGSGAAGGIGIEKGMKELAAGKNLFTPVPVQAKAHGGFIQPVDKSWDQKDKEEFSQGASGMSQGMITQKLRELFAGNGDQQGEQNYSRGGMVSGHAKVMGDSETNDTVPARLSPGEMVIPRSFAHDPDLSKAFINYMHKKQKESKKGNA